jgi:hypothetical protein
MGLNRVSFRLWLPWVLLIFLNALFLVNGASCDACYFDGNDEEDCKDYGKIDNEFVGWHLGSQDCMGEYKIKITSADPGIICASASSFVSDLRLGTLSTSTARLGLGVAEGGFFTQDATNNNAVVIKDSITIDGVNYDCETSERDCYNAMTPFFESDPNGQKEMKDVCDTLVAQNRVDRQLEQSTLRIRLCSESREGTTIPSDCDPLWTQVASKMEEYPDKDCSGFGFGIGDASAPGCEGTFFTLPPFSTSTSAGATIGPTLVSSWNVLTLGGHLFSVLGLLVL